MIDTSPAVPIREALMLEKNEMQQAKIHRTFRAIHDTYGPKSLTKKRRQLPGKRHWKNKTKVYAELEGRMSLENYNLKARQKAIIKNLWKQHNKHRLQD